MEAQTAAIRLYVGGLGERVTEDDIRKTFCNLGTVQSVDIIRTKGRSFAYINFLPSSHNSLPKLFSTYNGCSWKGGKLKLEKAKEHYIDRLKREWAEEAELKNGEHIIPGNVDESIVDSLEPESTIDLKNMEFRLFFPKLRKIKPLPLSGTGKHKYSFRRLEAPPLPVHFCDCPEHSVPVQTHTVKHANDSGIKKGAVNNMTNSVMKRFPCRETSLDRRVATVHDSVIQDDGVNEEEINMMDSVMKKLLNRGTSSKRDRENLDFSQEKTALTSSKRDRENLDISQEKMALTSDIPEVTNDRDDGTDDDDDDDIEINAMTVQSSRSFVSRSEERLTSLSNEETFPKEETNYIDDETDDDDIQINVVAGRNDCPTSLANEMTRLNEKRNHDDLARQNKPVILNQKIESSNKKRKLVSAETHVNDSASPIYEKKEHLKTLLKKSVEHGTVKSQTEPKTEKSATNGMWSQKFAWKQLIGDGNSRSFTLSQITSEDVTNHEELPKLGNKGSSDIKKSKKVHRVEPKTPTDSKENEEVNNGVLREKPSSQHNKKSKKVHTVVTQEPKPSDETPAGSEEHEGANDYVQTAPAAQPTKATASSESLDKVTQGSSWVQRSTWTQLVGGGNNSSFSISQILPGDLVQKQSCHKADDFSTGSIISSGAFFREQKTSSLDVSTEEKKAKVASVSRDTEVSKAFEGNDLSDAATKKILDSDPKPTSSYLSRGVEISESCPFMRNADSVKEWMTAKTAMSNSLKKMKNK